MKREVFLLLGLMLAASKSAGAAPPQLSTAKAKEFLTLAVNQEVPGTSRLSKFGLDEFHGPGPHNERFRFFDATWDAPQGSVLLGAYAIDPVTAKIWNFTECKEIQSPELRRIQNALRTGIPQLRERQSSTRPDC
jgi:hypothetical protein